jgi:hypothetical protein
MKPDSAIILGVFILISTLGHALLVKPVVKPLATGFIQGDVLKVEGNGVAHLKCNGFKAELYDSFVVIHVDNIKEPTWTGNYVLTIPWSKIENLSLSANKSM